ncbi:hypothetical protein GM921_04680 [Pedobacter sp. LMG 31464]|uniref:DUF5689 domain-containing protein n=1 Tax=Pedobacter planticolens TaxID=2679964 RepID=A0A923IUD5_9SPHI|nr:DUF5689 domain-containing protein [Pedobacter planticolens]MBB2144766.1 hypothetical protein [Pedobacter planticolens]
MKQTFKYFLVLAVIASIYTSCKRDDDYFAAKISGFISNFDLKRLYKETDLSLNAQALGGATMIRGIVISDFRSGNSPTGLLVLQNSRISGTAIDSLRGMSFNIGAGASDFVPGDSVHIKIDGGVLKRVSGILQITGLSSSAVTKVASGRQIKMQSVSTGAILTNPDRFESTLVTLTNVVFDPELAVGTTYSGDKTVNDGFGVATLHTETGASFANTIALPSGNFSGIPFVSGTGAAKKIQFWMRTLNDFFYVEMPKLSPAVIAGYMVDPNGGDGNYEYIQFLASKDIDFAVNPMSVYTTNNAGATTFPTLGWNTGAARTYKINLTSGTVKKGQFFYVGGTGKRINGSASTSTSTAIWIGSKDYSTTAGADGVGTATSNLLANSGNVAGIAIFDGVNITPSSVPLDVIFFGGAGGNFYSAGPPEVGYRITITDYYGTVNPATRLRQDFYGAGTNTRRLGFPSAATSFSKLGGVYNSLKGGWVTGRILTTVPLTNTSVLTDIESGATSLSN